MKNSKIYIGIDPDVDKSGVAMWDGKDLILMNLSFWELFDFLHGSKFTPDIPVKVRLEAGWLNQKINWHNEKAGVRVAAKIGARTGANHEVGRKIVEMCNYLKIPCELCVPKSSKVNKELFRKITGYTRATNPETRDAGMLVYGL